MRDARKVTVVRFMAQGTHEDRPALPATLVSRSNLPGKRAQREEEIAFLVIEKVLGVDIKLADAGTGNKMPDGCWRYPGDQERRGIVEVTSLPDKELMATWAQAKRTGEAQSESGSVPLRWNELAQVCTELLEEEWAQENIDKLVAQPADERHLFLFARSHRVGHYFYRLTDSYDDGATEEVDALVLPQGLTDVWFRGRSVRDPGSDTTKTWVARFQNESGWHRHVVHLEERHLPTPNPGITDDRVSADWRRPKDRSLKPVGDC